MIATVCASSARAVSPSPWRRPRPVVVARVVDRIDHVGRGHRFAVGPSEAGSQRVAPTVPLRQRDPGDRDTGGRFDARSDRARSASDIGCSTLRARPRCRRFGDRASRWLRQSQRSAAMVGGRRFRPCRPRPATPAESATNMLRRTQPRPTEPASYARRQRLRARSRMICSVAFSPGIPVTPPPPCVALLA